MSELQHVGSSQNFSIKSLVLTCMASRLFDASVVRLACLHSKRYPKET